MSGSILVKLQALADPAYADFHSRLMPTLPRGYVLGVRMPVLRALGKELAGTPEAEAFLRQLPHRYYEENNLHAILTEATAEPTLCLQRLEAFLPFVDNWATCDLMRPQAFRLHGEGLEERVYAWLQSGHEYTVRFGIKVLMDFFLQAPHFRREHFQWVTEACSEQYYVNMAAAWYFATALIEREEEVLMWLRQERLSVWVHNKTVQKAMESLRISDGTKAVLRTLKR